MTTTTDAALPGPTASLANRRAGAAFRVLFVMDEPDPTKLPQVPGGQMRVVSRVQCPTTGDITVRQDTIYLCSYEPTVSAVIITSRELARTVRALFELAWVGALSNPPLFNPSINSGLSRATSRGKGETVIGSRTL